MLDVVLASQAAGVAAVRAGVAGRATSTPPAATVIAEAGWGDAFTHGTGHGVGLDIHEAPWVARTSDATLAAGHVVTVEPGVYLPEHGGVRIEDTVVVTDDGCRPAHPDPQGHRRRVRMNAPNGTDLDQRLQERHDPRPRRRAVQLVEFQHVKPGKGGAFVRTTLKNVRTGAVLDRTFRAGETLEQAIIDKRDMQFLYNDGTDYVFMDNATYDQLNVSPTTLGDAANYLVDGSTAVMQMYGDEIVGVDLPASVELTIAETEPGVQGDRVSGASKPATLETGLVVQVPLFVEPGERVKVDTRTGEYITRA